MVPPPPPERARLNFAAALDGAGGTRLDNLLLLSILIATVAIPALAARAPDPRRALRWTLLLLAAFTLAYAFLVRGWYATHHVPEPFAP